MAECTSLSRKAAGLPWWKKCGKLTVRTKSYVGAFFIVVDDKASHFSIGPNFGIFGNSDWLTSFPFSLSTVGSTGQCWMYHITHPEIVDMPYP